MAFVLTTTMDDIIKQVFLMLNVIPAGGSVSADQETAGELAINSALHMLDSTNLYTGNTKTESVTIAAGGVSGNLTATGIHSVLGGLFWFDGTPSQYLPIEYVPGARLGAAGNPLSAHVPTKFTAVLAGQPESAATSLIWLNCAAKTAAHVLVIYREALTVMTTDSGTLELPPAYLRMVMLMMCCDLGAAFGVDISVRQEFRSLLTDAMNLALAGGSAIEGSNAMRAAAAGQGTVPPPLNQMLGGIP